MKLFARFCDQVAVTLTDNSVWVKLCENDLIWKQSYFKLICARKWRRTQLEARSNNWICKLTSWWACLVFMLMLYTTSLQISYMILENMPFSIAWQQKKTRTEKTNYCELAILKLWTFNPLCTCMPRPEISRAFPKHDLITCKSY